MFEKVALLGVGLIGGSLGLALKERGLAERVVGVARREETLKAALEAGICDYVTTDALEAATGADFVFLASPVGQMAGLCAQIAPVLEPGCLVSDGGSTKAVVVAECEPLLPKAYFIGGHPMAGSAESGPTAARADLFERAVWVLTPTPRTHTIAFGQMRALAIQLGARPLVMAPDEHDRLLAVSSHLPHLTASALVHSLLKTKATAPVVADLVASGWRDSTRVAAGNAEMWRDICLDNAPATEEALAGFVGELEALRALVRARDGKGLEAWLETAAHERRKF